MKNVLVFKTSVREFREVTSLRPVLDQLINSGGKWNFDLEDCDNILRVETKQLAPWSVIKTLNKRGYMCEELI